MAAIGAYGFVWISTPRGQPDEHGFAAAGYEKPAGGEQPDAAPAVDSTGVDPSGSSNGGYRQAVFQPPPVPGAGLKADTLRSRDEAPPNERPQLLAPVAVPAPWSAPAAGRDLADKPREVPTTGVAAYSAAPAPVGTASPRRAPPAGAENPAAPPPSAVPGLDREDIATFLARGRTYLANGDVSAARLAFRRAAENGDAQAALALGGTFDPLVLGSRDAPQRLEQLAQSGR
jgi:hypothetical protein